MTGRAACGGSALLFAIAVARPAAGQTQDSAALAARNKLWIRPVASFVLPGMGQLLGHQDRGVVYLALEAVFLSRFIQLTRDARRDSQRYRQLAYAVAQHGYAAQFRDTVFEYYELMERFTSSGVFDSDPGPGLTPETDASTYNGSVWLLARRTFWADPNTAPPPTSPEYILSINFYRSHAVGPVYQWSWEGASLDQQEFRIAIRRSDDGFRNAQNQLGLLLANHLASAVDALISSRLTTSLRRPASLRTTIDGRRRAQLRLTIAF